MNNDRDHTVELRDIATSILIGISINAEGNLGDITMDQINKMLF